jgi:Uma2 family endonuclease
MATVIDFEPVVDRLILDPDKHYEVIDGQIVEEPPLGAHETWIASRLDQSLGYHATINRMGRVATEMLFVIDRGRSLRRRPDVAFVSRERWALNIQIPRENAWDVVPDLAVEITSPTDMIDDLMDKLEEYFRAGVRLAWVIYPKHRKVYVYDSPTSVRILQVGDELDGGAVLPGFRMTLATLFEVQEDGPSPEA